MKKRIGKLLLFFTVVLLAILAGCGNGDSKPENKSKASAESKGAHDDWPDKLTLAVTGVEGMEELQRRYEPFQAELQKLLGIDVEFFPVSDRVISATAMEYGQVDLVLAGPSEYAQIKAANGDAEPLAGIQRDAYHTVIMVPEKSKIKEVKDLKGKKVAMKDVGSTSGHIGPSALLIDQGFDLDKDVKIEMLGDARIEALRGGDVDALATGVRDYDDMTEEDGEGSYRILAEGPPLPADPFVASSKLPESLRAKLKETFLEHQDELLKAMLQSEENDKYKKAKIIDVKDSDFDEMRETYKVLGIELQ
ncbi:phosphate/phosphite/phosphonate ABC transporter substrate-binding protein [Aciduricibacillus chroicocephali]|uniref:Phosphate/phosphite/phosphonate ABC transporter substrate-binding protein n=1 Tax=Aciduricibacillus chroicocephali TaxID=3054939 RepID=A0ABY9KVM9_9BACI|nr:phosphate/phosphite/phosphonate ABC transporter substrate-binding protein [Bacillaceae bacterium 44XB]